MAFEGAGLNARRPVLISALGRAWLAFCPDEERRAILRDIGGLTQRQETALDAVLERVRRDGYAFTQPPRPTRLQGMRGASRSGARVLGSLSMRFPRSAMSESEVGLRFGKRLGSRLPVRSPPMSPVRDRPDTTAMRARGIEHGAGHDPGAARQWCMGEADRDSVTPLHAMKHAMLRWALALRLTAACVVLAAALSQLASARAEPQGGSDRRRKQEAAKVDDERSGGNRCASLRRRDLPHAGAGGGRQRSPRGILHAPDLAGEPLRPDGGQPGRRAGHRAVHAADRRDARAHQRVRAAAGAARVGELPARAAHHVPRQPGSGRGRLQCRPRPGRSLARRPRLPAVRDPGLRPHRHGLRCGGLDLEAAAAAGGLDRADRRALRRARQADAREYASSSCRSRPTRRGGRGASSLPATGPKAVSSPATSGCAASTVPSWATGCRWSCTRAGVRARRSSSGSRKRAGRTRTRCVRSCGPRAAPASSSATRVAEMSLESRPDRLLSCRSSALSSPLF